MSSTVKFGTVDKLRSVVPAPVSSEGRGRPVADLVEHFEGEDPKFEQKYGLSSAALRAGDIIRTMRKAAGLSQAELAKRMSATVTQARISELEAGVGSQGPTWDVMERIAVACGRHLGALESPHTGDKELAPASNVASVKDVQNQRRVAQPMATEKSVADPPASVERTRVGARSAFAEAADISAALEPILSTASKAMIEINRNGLDALVVTFEVGFAFVGAMLGAKTLTDVARLQNELIRKQIEAAKDQDKEIKEPTKRPAHARRAATGTHGQ
jgi:transcriptional regulator with XRE-family HTH domain